MAAAIDKMQPKKRGRPATGVGTPVQVRIEDGLLAKLDAYRGLFSPEPSRPEAIRRILETNLASK